MLFQSISPTVAKQIYRFSTLQVCFDLSMKYALSNHLRAVQTMSIVVADGKSNWLEGIILICEEVQ